MNQVDALTMDGSSFKRSRPPKTSERIARQIVNHIVDNSLTEGTMLPNEKQLVDIYSVGRTTVREALRLLETRGVLTIKPGPHGGPVVRLPREDDLQEGLTLLLQFSGSSLLQVLEARSAIEPMMASLAAERLTDEQAEELRRSIARMRDNLNDHAIFADENQRFHSTIAEATGNHVLRVFNGTLKSMADGAVVGVEYTAHRRAAVADAHERVLSALITKDPVQAAAAMREHVEEAGQFWRGRYPNLVNQAVRWVD